MSSGNKFERLFKLWATVSKLVVDGKRDIDLIINFLQEVVNEPKVAAAPWTTDTEGNIQFAVTSNGMTAEQWSRHLESRGFRLSGRARESLYCASETPTDGVVYHIRILPSSRIAYDDLVTEKIRAYAANKGWKNPHWEVACLIRDMFSNEELEQMGLTYIITMHEPITDCLGSSVLLLSENRPGAGLWLHHYSGEPTVRWDVGRGFAFVAPQVNSQA